MKVIGVSQLIIFSCFITIRFPIVLTKLLSSKSVEIKIVKVKFNRKASVSRIPLFYL